MPRYAVYHATDIMQMVSHDETQWQINRHAYYQLVAEVEASVEGRPLSRAFRLTNHTDPHPWTENPEVVWHDATRPLRSTSVGDVICEPSGRAWMVLPFGFTTLERAEGDDHAAPED